MRSPTLNVGEPAIDGGPPLPIDGARLLLEGPLIRLLIGYHEPTVSEIEAVEGGVVELGIFAEGGLAAAVVRAGEEAGHWQIEARAPLILLDVPAHADSVGGDGAPPALPDEYPAELVLCEHRGAIVRALRPLRVPACIVLEARRAAHAQTARFGCVSTAVRAHETGLRSRTVREMMDLACARVRITD